jgi:integrase
MELQTLNKKIKTKEEGVFYKEIVNKNLKVVDKVFIIRFREDQIDKQITVGKYSAGIRVAYCKQKRNDILNKIRLGESFLKPQKYTFKSACDDYIEWAQNNKKSWQQDANMFEKHYLHLADKELKSLKTSTFEELKQTKTKAGYKPRTVQFIIGLARQIINHAIRNEFVTNYTNPIANGKIKMPTVDNAQIGFLTKEQASELLSRLYNKKTPLTYRLTVLLLHTGARFSEVASLKWHDIDFNNRLIYFKKTKNGNDRKIFMSEQVLKVLTELKHEYMNELVIPASNGKQLIQMPRQWQQIVDEMIPNNKTAGKYRITIHSLRHTHASWLAISGMSILEIKDQLGHKKLDMTLRYSHLIPSERHRQTEEVFNVS